MPTCICGNHFESRSNGGRPQKYCSRACNMRAWRAEHPERVAEVRAELKKKRRELWPATPVTCICGKEFVPRRGGAPQKYCSPKCGDRGWQAENPGYLRNYYAANREKAVVYAREYRKANPEKVATSQAATRIKHRKSISAREKAYRAKNKEKLKADNAKWRAANKEWIAAYAKEYQPKWRASKPGIGSHYMNNRRASKAANGGSHTLEQWIAKCAEHHHRCAYCGESKKLTRDHVIPLSRGGTDNIDNIVPSCKPCNSRKARRTREEYLALTA